MLNKIFNIQKNKTLDTQTKTNLLKQVDSKRDTWVNAKNREEEKAERLNLKRINSILITSKKFIIRF